MLFYSWCIQCLISLILEYCIASKSLHSLSSKTHSWPAHACEVHSHVLTVFCPLKPKLTVIMCKKSRCTSASILRQRDFWTNPLLFFTLIDFLYLAVIHFHYFSNLYIPLSGTPSLCFSLLGLTPGRNCGRGNLPIFCCFSDLSRSSHTTNLPHPLFCNTLNLSKGSDHYGCPKEKSKHSAIFHDCHLMCLHPGCRSTIRYQALAFLP